MRSLDTSSASRHCEERKRRSNLEPCAWQAGRQKARRLARCSIHFRMRAVSACRADRVAEEVALQFSYSRGGDIAASRSTAPAWAAYLAVLSSSRRPASWMAFE
jgi:hypothetical protein